MKKGVLLVLGMLLLVSTVEAKNGNKKANSNRGNYTYDNSVNFVERGVEFYVFTNGEFDFSNAQYDYNRRRTNGRNVRVTRDFRGRINRVGQAFVNYDRFVNVTRIGNVLIRYRRGQLTNVGNLRVQYNRAGYPIFYGNVNNNFYANNNVNINLDAVCDYNDAYFYRTDFRRNYNQFREDNNFFYYRARPNAKIGKRNSILKRRKPLVQNRNQRVAKKRAPQTYRKNKQGTARNKESRTTRSARI